MMPSTNVMSDQTEKIGTGRWVWCYWEERLEELDRLPSQPGVVAEGVLGLPPPIEDLAVALNIWATLNEELGILIDVAEETEITVGQLGEASRIIARFADRARAEGRHQYGVVAGQQIAQDSKPLLAELAAPELERYLDMLADFLADAAVKGKSVVLSL